MTPRTGGNVPSSVRLRVPIRFRPVYKTRNPLTSKGGPMVTAQAFVFDAYGTLFDVHSVVPTLQAITPEAEALSRLWRTKQLEYTWLRSLMGRYVDFWTVTEEALHFALTHYEVQLTPAQLATLLQAYLELAPYPEIPTMLAAIAPRPCVILSNGSPPHAGGGCDREWADRTLHAPPQC